MKPTILKILMRVLWGLGVFLLIITLAFEAIPLISGTSVATFRIMARQRVLEQRVVKDVLILAYRSSPEDHAEAISELQTTLPAWENFQNGLRAGDTSLGISPNMPGDVRLLLTQAQPDFTYLDAAAHQVLAHPSPVDLVQLSIILQHDQPYYIAMAQANDLFQERIQDAAKVYFGIEVCMCVASISIWIVLLFLVHSFVKRSKS
jgi:hypothetical protein